MTVDWQREVAEAVLVREQMRLVDRGPLFQYDPPHAGARPEQLQAAEERLGFGLDDQYRRFLEAADGWAHFYQAVSLFGTDDLGAGELYRHACDMLDVIDDTGVFESIGLARSDVYPIAASPLQSDIFVMVAPHHSEAGKVHWLAGYPVEEHKDFCEYFAMMLDFAQQQIADFEAENLRESPDSGDIYRQTSALCRQLREAGLDAWATQLDDDVAGGATSTEILMALRWHLRELLQEPRLPEGEVASRAASLSTAIEKALG